ncbi:MAG: phenylacetate--CoA ligase family protein [Bryobacterales bacterium]|nr:phenylacetate--CoA ligase family protein [Bryobacterales bacterium]
MGHQIERLYPYVPVWLQNVGISLYGYAYKKERLGGDFNRYVSGFRLRERWSVEHMNSHVEERLRIVLARAFDHVPYYRDEWARVGITRQELANLRLSELSGLPTITKLDVRRQPDYFVAEDIPAAQRRRYYTSGSTGTPISCVCTPEGHRQFIAAREARSFNWANCSIASPRSMIGGRMVTPGAMAAPPYYRYNRAERQVYFSAYHIRPCTVENYVEGFNRYRPTLLTGYAYSHYLLARLLCDRGIQLDYKPDALVLSSESLSPAMKIVIRAAFGARAYEEYGAVEQCVLATECEHGSLHVSPDFGIVEVVDDSGLPVSPGAEGRLICTSLLNDAQPFIRYEIGDIGAWSGEPCLCGRAALPVLKGLVGRIEDSVILRDGSELVRFHGVFIDLSHVLAGQIIQESLDHIHVKVIASAGFGAEDEKLIRDRIITERLGAIQVTIERVSDLERTPNGKIRGVISKVTSEQRNAIRTGRAEQDCQ